MNYAVLLSKVLKYFHRVMATLSIRKPTLQMTKTIEPNQLATWDSSRMKMLVRCDAGHCFHVLKVEGAHLGCAGFAIFAASRLRSAYNANYAVVSMVRVQCRGGCCHIYAA